MKKILIILTCLSTLFLISCGGKKPGGNNRAVIGIPADVSTFNPLFAFSVDEGAITELLYMSLADYKWNEAEGDLEAIPMLAKSWEWAKDSSSITFYLRDDIKWSDGVPLTVNDVVFSLDVYSDPIVNSRLYGIFDDFYTDEENHIDAAKTFVVKSDYELQMNFKPHSSPDFVDINHPIIPKHIFEKYARKDLETAPDNFNPVTSGAFVLKKWDKNQTITLAVNKKSFLHDPDKINELVFKVIPDYTSRLTQLEKGEIDLMELIRTEDINDLKSNDNIFLKTMDGRDYEYIGWNNIDPKSFEDKKEIKPNKLFGSKETRIALSYAINRKEILEDYLYNYGELAATPISPIFKSVYDSDIEQYEYNPEKAKQIFKDEGWTDSNNNGIIDKDGIEFEFTLTMPAGNPLRPYEATIIKNNLKAVGIEVNVTSLEMGAFMDDIVARKREAWMASWYISIPIELKSFWYSDLESTPLNFTGYQNKKADKLMNELTVHLPKERQKELYYQFQEIMHEDQPATFMYWIADIIGINKRMRDVNITPYGAITHCWEWSVK